MKFSSDTIEFQGDINIEVPEHMSVLSAKEISVAQSVTSMRVISCGIHPQTKELITIDQKGRIYEMALKNFFGLNFEVVSAVPVKGGERIEFDIVNAIVEAESEEIIAASKDIGGGELTININV